MQLAYLLWKRFKRKKVGERGRKKERERMNHQVSFTTTKYNCWPEHTVPVTMNSK